MDGLLSDTLKCSSDSYKWWEQFYGAGLSAGGIRLGVVAPGHLRQVPAIPASGVSVLLPREVSAAAANNLPPGPLLP